MATNEANMRDEARGLVLQEIAYLSGRLRSRGQAIKIACSKLDREGIGFDREQAKERTDLYNLAAKIADESIRV